jgi:glycosyltransferase involved in cell wall biosynthesis
MAKLKVLYVSHNHPVVRPGGAEAYALELHEAMRMSNEFEPIFLARTGPPVSNIQRPHEGTLFTTINDDPSQYFIYTDAAEFDWFYGTSRNKEVATKYFHEFLLACKPDIVHFQHSLFLGYDLLRVTRNTLPHVPIVYTLHEFLPICHRNGQMVRTRNDEPCLEASPRRCHECFPEILPQTFFMRKRFVQSHFDLVDLFIAPSHFLRDRFVDWGIPEEKVVFEEYGRHQVQPLKTIEEKRPHNRIAFFGQFNFFKGVNVLLQAMKILGEEDSNDHLWVHGANLSLQPQEFQEEFRSLIQATERNVTLVGRYDHDQLADLMANIDWIVVPSIWWENSPLVIQEAFQYGKPVICSNIGGMAEKVTDGVNGLHFRARDPLNLAQTIRRAISTPGLWEHLRQGIPQVYRMEDHVASLAEKYRKLLHIPQKEIQYGV